MIQARDTGVIQSRTNSPADAGKMGGVKQTDDRVWLVSFMDYDLGYFDDETCRLEPLANPFGPKVLPMSSV